MVCVVAVTGSECSGDDWAVAVCYKGTGTDKLKEIKVECQSVIQERERGQQDLSEAVKSFKVSITRFKHSERFLEDVCQQQTVRISRDVSDIHVVEPPKPESPNDFLQYFRQLHLDPNTVQKKLKLSEGNRKVSSSNVVQQYPDHPERFDVYYNVLCTEGLYGRCYWEVECCGNDWSVAVSYKEISRKGQSNDCRLGFNNKSWRLTHCFQDFYVRHDDKQVNIIPFHSSRIGVYLDHRAGTLCFYSVSDTMTLLYTFQTKFTEPLYPAFGIGEGSIKIIEQRKSHK
ncbi:hypothetical protein cypCar_00019425 [Cyprinus carpio]|nr:hypothetical protein cypCar_00019425 [Cyprinus carpio]